MDKASRLVLFADVIDSGSFSNAAKHRSVNRSLVSKQIANLEEELGMRLLHRTTRSLSLTDAGHAVFEHARSLRHQLLETDALVDSIREGVTGELRISSTTHFGRLHVMPVIKLLMDEYPALNIDLRLEDRYVDIVGERFDVALRVTEPVDSSLVARKLTDNPMIMVASPDYLKQYGIPETIDDLASHRFVVYAGHNGAITTWAYHQGSEIINFDMNVKVKVNDGYGLLKSALDGGAISLLPWFVSCNDLSAGRLVQILPDVSLESFSPLYVMYPSRRHVPKKTRLFIDFMINYIRGQCFYIS